MLQPKSNRIAAAELGFVSTFLTIVSQLAAGRVGRGSGGTIAYFAIQLAAKTETVHLTGRNATSTGTI
jgi:hypothetical protein